MNDPDGKLKRLFPMTLARMPDIPFPNINNHGLVTRLPSPPDTSVPLGYNPGGLRSGDMGDPLGPLSMQRTSEMVAEDALKEVSQSMDQIKDLTKRVEKAAQAHYEKLSFKPYKPPPVIPPMVASMGPDGVHTESPYGPWEGGVRPFAGEYEKEDMTPPTRIEPGDESIAKAGGFDKLVARMLATPFPPRYPGFFGDDTTHPRASRPGFLQGHMATNTPPPT